MESKNALRLRRIATYQFMTPANIGWRLLFIPLLAVSHERQSSQKRQPDDSLIEEWSPPRSAS
jgi:hypothetical protein